MTAPCGRLVAARPEWRWRPCRRSLSLRRGAEETRSPALAAELPQRGGASSTLPRCRGKGGVRSGWWEDTCSSADATVRSEPGRDSVLPCASGARLVATIFMASPQGLAGATADRPARPRDPDGPRRRNAGYLTILMIRSIPSCVCSRPSWVFMKQSCT